MNRPQQLYQIIKKTFSQLGDINIFKLSAALSYYTLFSLSPMLVVLMALGNLFFTEEIVQGHLYEFIYNTIGKESAIQIQETLKNQRLEGNTIFATTVGLTTLFIGATSMFGELQDSINQIWKVEVKKSKFWVKLLLSRLLSFAMIVILGLIMSISLVLDFTLDVFSKEMQQTFDIQSTVVISLLNNAFSVLLLILLFTLLFKLLPDIKLRVREVLPGAIFTASIFFIGKYLIALYLSHTAAASSYGSAGSIVVILLWVYFSSMFIYFGAIFTRQYILFYNDTVKASPFAEIKSTTTW
jgi:membrane protein